MQYIIIIIEITRYLLQLLLLLGTMVHLTIRTTSHLLMVDCPPNLRMLLEVGYEPGHKCARVANPKVRILDLVRLIIKSISMSDTERFL